MITDHVSCESFYGIQNNVKNRQKSKSDGKHILI